MTRITLWKGTDFTAAECAEQDILTLTNTLRQRILACANKVLARCADKKELACQASVVVHNVKLAEERRLLAQHNNIVEPLEDSKVLVFSSQEALLSHALKAEE